MDDRELRLLISDEEIRRRVDELAAKISRDYKGNAPILIGVLKGAFIFLADLARRVEEPPEIDFIQLSSYGLRGTERADIQVSLEPRTDLAGRHVIIVEDIVDSGETLTFLQKYLSERRPATLRICSLLARERLLDAQPGMIDYLGFPVGEGWLVGYGLDLSEKFRHLTGLYVVAGTP